MNTIALKFPPQATHINTKQAIPMGLLLEGPFFEADFRMRRFSSRNLFLSKLGPESWLPIALPLFDDRKFPLGHVHHLGGFLFPGNAQDFLGVGLEGLA